MDGEQKGHETIYHCPVPDFIVSKIELGKEDSYMHQSFSAEIILVTEGEATVINGSQQLHLNQGEAAFAGADEKYTISSNTRAVLFKAGVPE